MPQDQTALTTLRPTPFGPTVMLPDGTHIQAMHSGLLPFHPSLSNKVKTAHVLDGITNASQISVGQLCDNDCIAVIDKKLIKIFKNNKCILEGQRNTRDGLWDIAIPSADARPPHQAPPAHQLNVIIRKNQSKTELVQYLHHKRDGDTSGLRGV
jgi:hypothetical protein